MERFSSRRSNRCCASAPASSMAKRFSTDKGTRMTIDKFKRIGFAALAGSGALGASVGPALAAAPKIDSGDTAWMLTSSALVLMMTIPGLALFYGGMVRKKNVLATLAQSFGATCIITVLWMIVGYSIAFTTNSSSSLNQWIGSFDQLLLGKMTLNAVNPLAATIPESV